MTDRGAWRWRGADAGGVHATAEGEGSGLVLRDGHGSRAQEEEGRALGVLVVAEG